MSKFRNNNISKFHYITQDVTGLTHAELAELACRGGADWVQLRVKDKNYDDWKKITIETRKICKSYNATFIINDNVELAGEIQADGVHLGKEDMHPAKAREILGDSYIIGATANTFEDIQNLTVLKIDYIGLGPFRHTVTKKNINKIIGIEGFRQILNNCRASGITIPVIAIGGINTEDITDLLKTGIYGVAVSSAINLAEDKTKVTELLLKRL
ncbi:MAG: thiamine phosphate synthase [Bacteroidota bacterium]